MRYPPSVAGQRIALGGLGRRPRAEVLPRSLAARVPGPASPAPEPGFG
ncbi:MAG: hypothetical protein ACRDOH_17975 [Streptosporangiaceae bacterium]